MIRKQFAGFAASTLALAVSAQAFAGTVTTDGADLVIKTKSGLEVTTTDKSIGFKIGGRIQTDFDSFDGVYTSNNEAGNEAYFRRAQLEIGGNFNDWRYQLNADFGDTAGSSTRIDEASVTYTGFSPVNVRFGRFDPDFSLEKATSSKWITAIERSAVLDLASWTTGHENGIGVQLNGTHAGKFYGSASIQQQDGAGLEDADGKDVNSFFARGVYAPIVSETQVLHFGLGYAARNYADEGANGFKGQIGSRLGVRGLSEVPSSPALPKNQPSNGNLILAPAETGAVSFADDKVLGLEAAYLTGPLSVQGEYLKRDLGGAGNNGDREATGYNVQVAYTLTGESRGYKLDGAKFDAIKPLNKQTGAWEVFYRYDNLNVEDSVALQAAIDESQAKVHTVGVNWYVNEQVKLSANYLVTQTDADTVALQNRPASADDDSGKAISLRAQYQF